MAVVACFEFVYVGWVAKEGSIESVRVLVGESVRGEFLELVGRVGVRAEK